MRPIRRNTWVRYRWKAEWTVEWEILHSHDKSREGQKGTRQDSCTDRRLYKSREAAQQALPSVKKRAAKSQSGPVESDNPTWTLEELRNEY